MKMLEILRPVKVPFNSKVNASLLTCVLTFLGVGGCSSNQGPSLPDVQTGSTNSQTTSPQVAVCPTIDDARKSITTCTTLLDAAEGFLHPPEQLKKSRELEEQIGSWTKYAESWDKKNQALISNCELLLGADGTEVHPEIKPALEDTGAAAKFLTKAVEAARLGQSADAQTSIKRARTALSCATQLL